MGVPQHSVNAIHRGELPFTLSSGWTEDQGRNTIIKLPKTAYISFRKVWIQLKTVIKQIYRRGTEKSTT